MSGSCLAVGWVRLFCLEETCGTGRSKTVVLLYTDCICIIHPILYLYSVHRFLGANWNCICNRKADLLPSFKEQPAATARWLLAPAPRRGVLGGSPHASADQRSPGQWSGRGRVGIGVGSGSGRVGVVVWSGRAECLMYGWSLDLTWPMVIRRGEGCDGANRALTRGALAIVAVGFVTTGGAARACRGCVGNASRQARASWRWVSSSKVRPPLQHGASLRRASRQSG